ncbi:hypothetical protein L798_07441 [Zootermopsis nevadensis]|uniref:Uncharacterized protein n=1 Tax=Zootermopsis nevadensis TaxID=136037 RepID=A0A067RED6_ZOONE|nr:hypothetical protein L798_07441 [Zootermopsis nevadensis]
MCRGIRPSPIRFTCPYHFILASSTLSTTPLTSIRFLTPSFRTLSLLVIPNTLLTNFIPIASTFCISFLPNVQVSAAYATIDTRYDRPSRPIPEAKKTSLEFKRVIAGVADHVSEMLVDLLL